MRDVLEGDKWQVYLSDDGYSRLWLYGPGRREPTLYFDVSLAGPNTKVQWQALVDAGHATPNGHLKSAIQQVAAQWLQL